ncbi:pentapeptide repeat-containing protein [Streptomyces goshikiensis]|uniref:pentapeptide repeat-containing protein n=1 Tax=Streptomyces goshikiensis TaxID=1942 RepID=UPI003647F860
MATASVIAAAGFTLTSIIQVNNEQADTRDSQITDRYNDAVSNFDKENSVDVRLGGIYALQRIMQDSPRDQSTVLDVLSAYIRTHAPEPKKGTKSPFQPEIDVVAALSVLTTRHPEDDGARYIDLADAHLTNAQLVSADLTRAHMASTNLEGADLSEAKLIGAVLDGSTNLKHTKFWKSDLSHADLRGVDLTEANLYRTDLSQAKLSEADLGKTDLYDLDLAEADLQSADLTEVGFQGARLRGANLSYLTDADLTWANLRGAVLNGVNLTSADLKCADLRGTNLDGLRRDQGPIAGVIVTEEQLLTARIDSDTKLPAELANDPHLKDRVNQDESEQGNGECTNYPYRNPNDYDFPYRETELTEAHSDQPIRLPGSKSILTGRPSSTRAVVELPESRPKGKEGGTHGKPVDDLRGVARSARHLSHRQSGAEPVGDARRPQAVRAACEGRSRLVQRQGQFPRLLPDAPVAGAADDSAALAGEEAPVRRRAELRHVLAQEGHQDRRDRHRPVLVHPAGLQAAPIVALA